MKIKDKLLLFLALNATTVPLLAGTLKYDKLYDKMTKNLETGKSNDETYKLLNQILAKRNKELNDLYVQNDYIIKPEYLEWQIFFSGFYEEHGKKRESVRKPYQTIQSAKEIDLGISLPIKQPEKLPVSLNVAKPTLPSIDIIKTEIPNISSINPTLPILNSFDIPVITTPTTPIGVTVTSPSYTSVTAGNFNAVQPNVTTPLIFSPVSLNFTARGFSQSADLGFNDTVWFNPKAYVILNNGSLAAADPTGGTTVSIENVDYTITNKIDWQSKNDRLSMSGTYGATGIMNTPYTDGGSGNITNAFRYAFLSNVASDTVMTGDWFFENNVTSPSIGGGIVRFVAVSHGYGMRDQIIKYTLEGSLHVKGSENGSITIVFENQYYDYLPSQIINNGVITVDSGKNVFVASLMNEGGYKCNQLYFEESPGHGCSGGVITKKPMAESKFINNGSIVMKNEQSIGIDFGNYMNIGAPLYTYIEPGNMSLQGKNSYAIRIPNIFSTYRDYFKETVINGARDVISLEGERNIGISLLRRVTDSTETAPYYGYSNSDTTNPIGNIKNLRFVLNGEQNIGLLRDVNYATQDILLGNSDIILNDSNVQELRFGNESSNSALIRTDRAKIILAKNLVLDAVINSGKGNNIVMIANDSTANNINGAYKSSVENRGSITFEKNLFKTTGLAAINGGIAVNSGSLNINSLESNGLVVFSGSSGENKGTINLNGRGTLGVYNLGNFNMPSGTITSGAEDSIGVYANNTVNTNISGGNITAENGGIALYSGGNATINLSGTGILTADSGGLLFYNHETGGTYTGKYNISSGTTAKVKQGGLIMYMKVNNISEIGTKFPNLKGAFLNASNLTVDMEEGSSVLYIDGASGVADITGLNAVGLAPGGMSSFFNFTGSGYNEYVLKDMDLRIDTNSSLDTPATGLLGTYKNIQFLQSSITVDPLVTVSGTQSDQVGIVQRNTTGRTVGAINIENNGTISLSGNKSTGIAGDHIIMRNTGTGKIILGTNSVGIYTANGSLGVNEGVIELNSGSVGIYGRNYFDGLTNSAILGYGTDKINIENQKEIRTVNGGVTGNATGIYADNILTLGDGEVNLTSTSNINLKGTATVIGAYLKKTSLTSLGTIKVETASGGTSVGIYGDESTGNSISGSIEISGGSGTGIYLKDSLMSSNASIKVDNVNSGIGIYVDGSSSSSQGINTNTILLGDSVTGMYGLGSSTVNTGEVINKGTIQSLSTSSNKAIGMYIGANGIGTNEGGIYLTAVNTNKDQVGVYNSGKFNMTSGNVEVYSKNGAGLYTTGEANLSGGTIKTGNGAIGLYTNGGTINLSGTYKSIVENDGIFALNDNGGTIDVSGTIKVDIEAGGLAFSSVGDFNTYLGNLITGSGVMELNLKDSTSKLAILDSPGTLTLSSLGTAYVPGSLITPQVKISSSSNPNYTPFSITKGHLVIDQAVDLNQASDIYNRSDFINSSVDVNNVIRGTSSGQLAVGQVNYSSGIISNITLINNNIIDLSGNNSTGILADFGLINNTGAIKVTGDESVGIYAVNGTMAENTGIINIGNKSVGIYGTNYLDGVTSSSVLGYGNDTINITNNGDILSTGTVHGGYGIYADNIIGNVGNSTVTLGSNSNIDISNSEKGIGIYAVNSTLNINGNITVGKNGIGVYASGSTGTISGGTVKLTGDNAVGYYLTNGTTLTNSAGSIFVDGNNIVIMITDAGSNINLSNPFVINSTSGSTYVLGNMIGGDFHSNISATLGSNGALVNGTGTIALFGTGSNVNSIGTNVSGMILNGQHSGIPGHIVSGSGGQTVNEEGTNLGTISLGDSSAGMYLIGGARGRNEGTIEVNNNSVGMYGEGTGSYIVNNNGNISVGKKSTGIFLKDGLKVENTGTSEIKSTGEQAVGIYSENILTGSSTIINDTSIDLSGDNSIGIYTTGENNTTNNGIIKIGNSLSQVEAGVGIYTDHINSNINNASLGVISVGDNGIGIYNIGGNIINDGEITAGDGGTGIYSEGGTITLNAGSSITVGQNNGVGVYAVNHVGTLINNTSLSVGDGSYGFVFTGTTAPLFTNNQSAVIGNNSVFVYSDSVLTADNNGLVTMTGSGNIGYYLKNGGLFTNNADIIGNTGVSNIGVYVKDANIVNNADIILGDSLLTEHTDSKGGKYKKGYSVGIYGENSNITNNTGKTIQVGQDGIGIYIKGTGYTAENYGIINGLGDNAKGIYASDNAIVKNYGTINMSGNNIIGIAGQNGAQIYNSGIINISGADVTGIYLSDSNTKLVNHGEINITGTGLGISYTPTVNKDNIENSTDTSQGYTSKQYTLPEMPTLINTGKININVGDNFNYDGIRVIITIDSTTNTPTTNSSSQIGFGGVIPDRIEIAPDFAIGTASDRYIFENIFKGVTGKGEYISQSLTWDATAQGSDLVMTRKDYTEFTDSLWYEDFGRELNNKYAVTNGEGRKIFDKINYITNESDFRHIMGSLAGEIYSNINQREEDIARSFENSLHLLEDSKNNTKENVKISIIAGRGKNKGGTDGVVNYDYSSTGVLGLREIERTYKHTFGYSLGYLHTGFEFNDGNSSEEKVDTLQLGVHNKYRVNDWLLKNDLTGRVSIHNINRNIDWPSPTGRSELNGTYETYSISSDNRLGKELSLGKNGSITPYGGVKATYITRPTFSEKGLESLEVEGNDAWSVKPRAGIELKGSLPLGSSTAWQLKGALDVSYEYELANLNERERAKLTKIEDNYHNLSKPEKEKGTLRTKAEIGVEVEDRYGIFLTGEYGAGNNDKDDYRAGVTLKAVF